MDVGEIMFEIERNNFIKSLLSFQDRMELSNHKMAEVLQISERTYCRFISGDSVQREFDLVMRAYELSGKMMYELTGAKIPRELENTQIYSQLNEQNKKIIDIILRDIYELQLKTEK